MSECYECNEEITGKEFKYCHECEIAVHNTITTLRKENKELKEQLASTTCSYCISGENTALKARVQELEETLSLWDKHFKPTKTLKEAEVRPLLKQVDLLVKKLIIQRARGQLMLDWEKDLIEVHRYYTYSRQLEAMQGVLKEGCDE